jgi:hypothetical protein
MSRVSGRKPDAVATRLNYHKLSSTVLNYPQTIPKLSLSYLDSLNCYKSVTELSLVSDAVFNKLISLDDDLS